ncbi:MAG TPA: thermonuclease family protein [Gemmatimonadaceae bacterium]|nr:thermonuclease family protein [Gemmatimonadaceae bacterium]
MRRRLHLTGCLGLLFGLTLIAQAATTSSIRGRVSRVVDGDTIVVDTVGTVRLIGIDSPETKDPRRPVDAFGAEASHQMSALALNQDVRLEFEGQRRDVYGRTLAYVYLADDRMLNVEMIRRGFAHAYTTYPFSKMEEFRSWQRDAQRDSRGLWSTPSRASTTEQGPVQPGQSVAEPLPEPAEVLVDTGPRTTALYHRDTCAWVRGATTTVRLTSSDAKSRYFQAHCACVHGRDEQPPCAAAESSVQGLGVSAPRGAMAVASPTVQRAVPAEAKPAVSSGRCQATTQKGAQCKRSAQPGRSNCWQH